MPTIVQTGFKLAQTVISNGAVTGNEWSNPNNLLLTDGDLSESNPGAGVASDVVIGNFLAQVPANAVITGIELQIIGKAGAQTSPVLTLTPYALDNTSGTDNYYPYITPYTGLTPELESHILGSPTYLFATAWTSDMINNFKLQFVANGDIYIDSALLNVFYYIPDEVLPPPPPPTECEDCNSPIQAQPFYLAQPFLAGDRYAYLQSFNYPDGTPIQYADLGSCGGYVTLVFDPAVPKVGTQNFEENAKTAVWETQPDGTIRLDFVDIDVFRGLMFHTPYTADPELRSGHDQNSKVIISDSAPFLGQYLQRCQIGTVVSKPIEVKKEGASIVKPAVKLNFLGNGVVVVQDGADSEQADITIPGISATTPVVTAVGSATSGNSQVSTIQFDLLCTGVNRGIDVQISTEQLASISSITRNGIPFVRKVFATDVAHNLREEQWFQVAPSLGTFPVIITLSQAAYISAGGEALVSVNQSSPTGATATNSGTSLAPSVALVTTVDNSNIFDGLVTAQTPILYTPGTGQVLEWSFTANADTRQGSSSYLPAGSTPDSITMQYAITQNTPWVMTGLEIKGLAGAAPVVTGLTVEDVPAGVVVPNTSLLVFPAGTVSNPLPNKAVITFPSVPTIGPVKVDAADTTPDYLDSKLNIHSSDSTVSVTKTVTNPAGDEILDYDLKVSLSGGILDNVVNANEASAGWMTQSLDIGGSGWNLTAGSRTGNGPLLDSSHSTSTIPNGLIGYSNTNPAWTGNLNYDMATSNPGKKIKMKFVASTFTSGSSSYAYGGFSTAVSSVSPTATADKTFRFVINNSTVYAVTSDGTGNTNTPLGGVSVGTYIPHVFEIVWNPGTDVKYYVDGVLKATHTTTIPASGAINIAFGCGAGANMPMSQTIVLSQQI